MENIICPYCGSTAKLVDSKIIYGRSYGKVWVCGNFPGCDSFVGVHKGTNIPLGTLANKELRKLRNTCHILFDSLWKSGAKSRDGAYSILARTLKIKKVDCHIALFDVPMCKQMIRMFESFREK